MRLLNGKMLQASLERGGLNLSVEGDIIYVDVTNNRIGVNTSSPTVDFEVNGTSKLSNITHSLSTITSPTTLDIVTTSNGFLTLTTDGGLVVLDSTAAMRLPVGTDAQKPGNIAGLIRWNTDITDIEFNDGSQWVSISAASALPTSQRFIPDGIQTTYTLNKPATNDTVLVIINGLVQDPFGTYDVTGTTLTITPPLLTTDIVSVRFLAA